MGDLYNKVKNRKKTKVYVDRICMLKDSIKEARQH